MLITYFVVLIISIVIGRKAFRNILNPISMYSILWFICFFFHECGLIDFNPIGYKTFFVLLVGHISFITGCLIAVVSSKRKIKIIGLKENDDEIKKKMLVRWIWIFTFISGITIIKDFYDQIKLYGTNIIANFAYRYSSQLRDVYESNVDLSSLIFPLIVFVGIYIVQYGFQKKLIAPLIVLLLFALIQGARGTLIIVISLFLSQITISKRFSSVSEKKAYGKNKRKYLYILLVLFVIVLLITVSRKQYFTGGKTSDTKNQYTEAFSSIASYTAEGIGCLDQYMENPIQSDYPQYFFRVPIILLNKLGITDLDTRYHINVYYIPFASNVITYYGELYHDFGNCCYVIVLIMAFLFSRCYIDVENKNNIFKKTMYSVFFTIFALSFFANFFHVASLWYVLVIGGFASILIDKRITLVD